MFTHDFKRHLIRIPCVMVIAFGLFKAAAHGQDEGEGAPQSLPSSTQTQINKPSVEQALVPEGVFVMQLAEALKLGRVADEAKAEDLLSGLGIEPKNGWIAEYPVTPAVLGDVEKGILAASKQGKIALKKDQALKVVNDVKTRLGLNVSPGLKAAAGPVSKRGNMTIYSYTDSKGEIYYTDVYDSIPKAYRNKVRTISRPAPHGLSGSADDNTTEAPGPEYMANPNTEDINDYYAEQGPPIVTYYSPPDPYSYLYSWVPYPFWSTGFYFPGFFVLNNFHRHVSFNRHPYFVSHHESRAAFHNPLRGDAFNRAMPSQATPNGIAPSHWFSSRTAQAGASAIVSFNHIRNPGINRIPVSQMNASGHLFSPGENSRILNNAPAVLNGPAMRYRETFRHAPYYGRSTFNSPVFNQVPVMQSPPRVYSSPDFGHDRGFQSFHSFNGNVSGGFRQGGAFGGFSGGGNFGHAGSFTGGGNFGHGGSFAGGARGGGHR
ncbi:MAG: hypothetical protein PHY16_06030 [Methylobacter sp.]|nr:hypothetical protein [Methylobacter sp.]